jgi:hypothetical protein
VLRSIASGIVRTDATGEALHPPSSTVWSRPSPLARRDLVTEAQVYKADDDRICVLATQTGLGVMEDFVPPLAANQLVLHELP